MFLYDVGYAPTSPRMTEARRQPRTFNEIRATMSRWVRLRNILPLSRYAILFTTSDESFFCSPCQQRSERPNTASGYEHGARRCWCSWTHTSKKEGFVNYLLIKDRNLCIFAHNEAACCYKNDPSNTFRLWDPPSCVEYR